MKFLITAGGTREYIDPVRYITNASTGKMGYALAKAAINAGHDVTLITAPTNINPPVNAELIKVCSSKDMYQAVRENFENCDCLIMAAAVSDYTPAKTSKIKLKKSENKLNLELKPTKDILKWTGNNKKNTQFVVGFALEDENILENAEKKLISKKIDMIIANSPTAIAAEGSTVHIKQPDNQWIEYSGNKAALAKKIINIILKNGIFK